MAETAAVRSEQWYAPLPLVGEGLPWVSADAVPDLAAARAISMQAGQEILDKRTELLREGEFGQVPYAVDPLTTTTRFLEAEELYGPTHSKTLEARDSLDVDSERLYAEARRKHSWEYHPELEQPYDAVSKSYTFHGRLLSHMVEDGITPIAEPEEVDYRLGEKVEEDTYGAIRELGRITLENVIILKPAQPQLNEAPIEQPRAEVNVLTISECADWAITAYESGKDIPLGGYVPAKRKYKIRGVRYGVDTDSRFMTELGVSGEIIEHEDFVAAMEVLGMIPEGTDLTKKDVRAMQMINMNGYGVLELQELLDELASRRTGKRVYMGEETLDDQPKNYASVPEIAAERERQLKPAARELSDFLITLERQKIDHWAANGLVEDFVKKGLFEMVKSDPEAAAVAFDEKTAAGVAEIAQLRQQGAEEQARIREQEVFAEAPAPAYCGAGSCGLESVDFSTKEGKELAKQLGYKNGESAARDTERPCPNCKKTGDVYYAYDKKVVKKYCKKCKKKTEEKTDS
jgi:hypothetical protein